MMGTSGDTGSGAVGSEWPGPDGTAIPSKEGPSEAGGDSGYSPSPPPPCPQPAGAPSGGQPPYGNAYGSPPYGAPSGGQPPYGNAYGSPPYGPVQGGYYPPYQQAQPTSGLAIASFLCSVGGILIFPIWPLTAIVGTVLGFSAKSQIDKSGGAYGGRGFAIAGIIIGMTVVAITVIVVLIIFLVASSCHTVGPNNRLVCH